MPGPRARACDDHPATFAEYAASGTWTAAHLGQFAAMVILLAGLFGLFFALDARTEAAAWAGRFGAAAAVAALALFLPGRLADERPSSL